MKLQQINKIVKIKVKMLSFLTRCRLEAQSNKIEMCGNSIRHRVCKVNEYSRNK